MMPKNSMIKVLMMKIMSSELSPKENRARRLVIPSRGPSLPKRWDMTSRASMTPF